MDPYSELIIIFKSTSDANLFQRRLEEIMVKEEIPKKQFVWRSDSRIVRLWTKEDIKDCISIIRQAVGKLKHQAIDAGKNGVRMVDWKREVD